MRIDKNNLPLVEEQQFLPEEQAIIQEILAKFQQLVPTNFTTELGQPKKYWGSTEGLDKPLCERYSFVNGKEWITLDIPHSLLTELGIGLGQEIPYSVYVSPSVLDKELNFSAFTIDNKEEIFIQKPLSITNLEQELTNWLEELRNSHKQISQLTITEKLSQELGAENQLLKIELQGEKQLGQAQSKNQKNKIKLLQDKLQEREKKIRELEEEKNTNQQELGRKNGEITEIKKWVEELKTENKQLQTKLNVETKTKEKLSDYLEYFRSSDTYIFHNFSISGQPLKSKWASLSEEQGRYSTIFWDELFSTVKWGRKKIIIHTDFLRYLQITNIPLWEPLKKVMHDASEYHQRDNIPTLDTKETTILFNDYIPKDISFQLAFHSSHILHDRSRYPEYINYCDELQTNFSWKNKKGIFFNEFIFNNTLEKTNINMSKELIPKGNGNFYHLLKVNK